MIMADSKVSLLVQFLNEHVNITLDSKTAIQMESGEVVEVSMIADGVMLDFDDDFVLLGQEGKDSVELISRQLVLGVKTVDVSDITMNDPDRPDRENMN
jgi:hypothetical protein